MTKRDKLIAYAVLFLITVVTTFSYIMMKSNPAPNHRGLLGEDCLPDGSCGAARLECGTTTRWTETGFACIPKKGI